VYPSTNRFAPSRPFHRRDLTVSRTVDLSGKPRIAAYGGVFAPGTFTGYVNPVYIEPYSASTSPMAPDSFEQLLSQYHCPSLAVFDARTPAVYTVYFGGISQYHYGAHPPALVRDAVDLAQGIDGIPFIDTISGMQLTASGTRGFVLPQPMPPPPGSLLGAKGYFGAEARLLMDPGTPMVTDSVVNLGGLQGPMTVGFICGGIEAFGPYTAQAPRSTIASPYFFEVTLAPTAMDVTPMPNAPGAPAVKSAAPVGRER
jgi:hypothetical protein